MDFTCTKFFFSKESPEHETGIICSVYLQFVVRTAAFCPQSLIPDNDALSDTGWCSGRRLDTWERWSSSLSPPTFLGNSIMLKPVCILNILYRGLSRTILCVCVSVYVYSVTHARPWVPLKAAFVNKGGSKLLPPFAGLTSCTSPEPRLQSVSGWWASLLCKHHLNKHRRRGECEARECILKVCGDKKALWRGLGSERLHFSVLLGRLWNLPAVTRMLLWASKILSHRDSEEKPANLRQKKNRRGKKLTDIAAHLKWHLFHESPISFRKPFCCYY